MLDLTDNDIQEIKDWLDKQIIRSLNIEALSYHADVEDELTEQSGEVDICDWVIKQTKMGRLIFSSSFKNGIHRTVSRLTVLNLDEMRRQIHNSGQAIIGDRPAKRKYYAPIPGSEK